MYYSSIGALAFLVTLIIHHNVWIERRTEGEVSSKFLYRRFLFVVMVYYFTDFLWGFLYEWKIIPLIFADTTLYFASMSFSVCLWTRYVVRYLRKKTDVLSRVFVGAGDLLLAVQAVVLIVNFFVPVMFTFNENGVYQAKEARYLFLAAQIVLFLANSIHALAVSLKAEGLAKRRHRTIGFSGIVMCVFIVLQTFFPLLPYYAMGCLIASCLIHTFVAQDDQRYQDLQLGSAKEKAYVDALTGIRNALAYTEAKEQFDQRITDGTLTELGVAVFDLNGLKIVNDTEGHEAGDRYIQSAARAIREGFRHSQIFRIGGDEFAALLTGDDYNHRSELVAAFDRQMEDNQLNGLVVVSCGLDILRPESDPNFNAVFERADQKMYERKKQLKEMKRLQDSLRPHS